MEKPQVERGRTPRLLLLTWMLTPVIVAAVLATSSLVRSFRDHGSTPLVTATVITSTHQPLAAQIAR